MLATLSLRNFRNLDPLDLELGPGSHLLLGENGAGKTSVLEAIYVLSTTRSFRAAQLADCRRHGEDAFSLSGEVAGEVRTALEVSWWRGERRRAVNGKQGSLIDHLTVQPVVVWSAADAEALSGEPRLRRRLLDRGVVSLKPATLAALARYRHALAQKRSALLSQGADLAAWDQILAQAAAAVIALRQRYFERLAAASAEVLAASGLPLAAVELAYRPSPAAGAQGEAAVFEALEKARPEERRRGLALVGPHRDDLEVRLGGHPVRRVASAGERRALGLLLAAAHGRVLEESGRPPVYLLDDADAELSRGTLRSVWGVFGAEHQTVVTSSRQAAWEGLPMGRRWQVSGGRLRAS